MHGALAPIRALKSPHVNTWLAAGAPVRMDSTAARAAGMSTWRRCIDCHGGKYTLFTTALVPSGSPKCTYCANSFPFCPKICKESLTSIPMPPLGPSLRLCSTKVNPGTLTISPALPWSHVSYTQITSNSCVANSKNNFSLVTPAIFTDPTFTPSVAQRCLLWRFLTFLRLEPLFRFPFLPYVP